MIECSWDHKSCSLYCSKLSIWLLSNCFWIESQTSSKLQQFACKQLLRASFQDDWGFQLKVYFSIIYVSEQWIKCWAKNYHFCGRRGNSQIEASHTSTANHSSNKNFNCFLVSSQKLVAAELWWIFWAYFGSLMHVAGKHISNQIILIHLKHHVANVAH